MVRMKFRDPTTTRIRPKTWSVRWRASFNRMTERLFGRRLFALSIYDLFGDPPAWQRSVQRKWYVFSNETNFPYAIFLLLVCLGATTVWKLAYPHILPELWPEMGGMTLDVFFILIVFSFFEHRRSQAQFIARQRETIDDYKRWDDPEARIRIAGAIRRLNRAAVFSIDFSGLQLSDFSFAKHGIAQLSGSNFYDGAWGEPLKETGVSLTRVSFDHVNCGGVEFSPFDPFEGIGFDLPRYAKLQDCTFVSARLQDSRFNGALLSWSKPPPDSHHEIVDYDEDGAPQFAQVTYGPFDRANLAGTSFRGCRFVNADFRNADGLLSADFFRATGLESAEFDDDATKSAVLASAARPE